MILSALTDADRYAALHPLLAPAFAFLRAPGLANLPPGRHPIDGDRLYALVQMGPGRRPEDAQLEAHERYLDVQYLVSGVDRMGWSPHDARLQPTAPFDAERDIVFFRDPPQAWIDVHPGSLVIFHPWDAHLPSIAEGTLHKVVIKARVQA